jgi:hypothetical protein
MVTHLQIIGILQLTLAVAHAYFPRYFQWHKEVSGLTLLTRQIFFVHHTFIAITVGLMGLLTLLRAEELISTTLGNEICLGFAFFWGIRAFCQLFVYSPSLWRGKAFETFVHLLFLAFWSYMTMVYAFSGFSVCIAS